MLLVKDVDPRFDVLYNDHLKIIKTQEERFHEKILEKMELISLKIVAMNEKNLERTQQIETNMIQLNKSFQNEFKLINQENKLLHDDLNKTIQHSETIIVNQSDKLADMILSNSEKQHDYLKNLNKSLINSLDLKLNDLNSQNSIIHLNQTKDLHQEIMSRLNFTDLLSDSTLSIKRTENKLGEIEANLIENINATEKKLSKIESETQKVSNEALISNNFNQQNDRLSLFINSTDHKLEELQAILIENHNMTEKKLFDMESHSSLQNVQLSLLLNSSDDSIKEIKKALNEYKYNMLNKLINISIEMNYLSRKEEAESNHNESKVNILNYSNEISNHLNHLNKSLNKQKLETKQLFENLSKELNQSHWQDYSNEINLKKSIVNISHQLKMLNSRLEKSLNESNVQHKNFRAQLAAFNERRLKINKTIELNFYTTTETPRRFCKFLIKTSLLF